jgi:4,5-dihydroxyphthalate decarboxylase
MDTLTMVLGTYPHAKPLQDGEIGLDGYRIEPVRVEPVIGAYRRMIRDLEFDVCELAPVSYLMARQAGAALTAIPVFLNRRFHHADVECGAASGIREPRELEGRRIGVRAYTVSTGVWVRGVLSEEYGVDLSKVEWVVDDEDHVEGRNPPNVTRVTDGRSLGQLLRAGEIDAALSGNAGTGRAGAPREGWASQTTDGSVAEQTTDGSVAEQDASPYPLFPEAQVLAADWYRRTGIYPLHSMIAIRGELVERDPGLPAALYAAFAEAKRQQVAADPGWTALPRFAEQSREINGDPVPYGVSANAPSLDALVRYCRAQGLLDADFPTDPRAWLAEGDYPDA